MAAKIASRGGLIALAGLVLGAAAFALWGGKERIRVSVAQDSLPALPDVSARPAELGKILRAAYGKASAAGDAGSVAELAGIFHINGFFAEARGCWLRLRSEQPAEPKWPYYLSDLARTEADEAGLRSWLEETVRLAPNYGPAWLELGDLEFKTRHVDRAAAAYRQRLRLIPGDPYASLGLARLALQLDHRTEGKVLIEELVKRSPDFPSSRNLYAEILAQEGDQAGAANQRWLASGAGRFRAAPDPWKEELRQWCCDADQLIVWGAIDHQTNRGDRGKASFERAISLEPKNAQAQENLGMYYLEEGDTAKAAGIFEQGAQLPGASEMLFSALGHIYIGQHRPEQARQMAEQALARNPASSILHDVRGLALAAEKRPSEAIDAFHAAMVASPGSAEPVTDLGILLLRLGRRDEGVVALRKALELQPAYVKATEPLAYLEMESGNLPAAGRLALGFFQQYPGKPEARALLGNYFMALARDAARRQDSPAVEQACRQGLALLPESGELTGALGVFQLQQGRLTEAFPTLQQAYRLQPSDSRVALVLADLYLRQGRGPEARSILEKTLQEARRVNDAAVTERATQMLGRIP